MTITYSSVSEHFRRLLLSVIINSASFVTRIICCSVFVSLMTLFVLHNKVVDLKIVNSNYSKGITQCMKVFCSKVNHILVNRHLLTLWSGDLSTAILCPLKPRGRALQIGWRVLFYSDAIIILQIHFHEVAETRAAWFQTNFCTLEITHYAQMHHFIFDNRLHRDGDEQHCI
jgi:hypothetical protein